MNKAELISRVAEVNELTGVKATAVINSIFAADGIIAQALAGGDKVSINDFATFATRVRAARQGLNPATQEKIQIPAKRQVHIRVGKGLKAFVAK